MNLEKRHFALGMGLMTPAILLMLFVAIYPIFYGFRYSFYETHYLETVKFIGLNNYVELLKNPQTIQNIKNSLIYVGGCLVFALPIGILLSVLLNAKIKGVTFFRTIIIFPWIFSQTVTALLFVWLIDANFGPLNYFLKQLGLTPVDLLSSLSGSMWAVIAANVWRTFPFVVVMTLAALQTVPNELYEAVRVDGGSPIQSFLYVTIPYILTTLVTVHNTFIS